MKVKHKFMYITYIVSFV